MAGLLSFLSDITVKPPGEATGPLASLGKTDYGVETYRYPSDLASSDKGHYMLININVQRHTEFKDGQIGDKPVTFDTGSGTLNSQAIRNVVSTTVGAVNSVIEKTIPGIVGTIKSVTGSKEAGNNVGVGIKSVTNEINSLAKNAKEGVRAIKRIKTVVALYMPDTLVFDHHQSYSDVGMGGELLTGVAAGGQALADVVTSSKLSDAQKIEMSVKNLSPFLLSMAAKNGGGFGQIMFAAATGVVQNPMLEVLYSSPSFRTFRFDFQFYPRSEKESFEVQQIIKTLRFHQAPEGLSVSNGFFMVPPSEFNISFYYNGQENPNIPKLGICVLETLTVDYAPSGFSAYEVPGQSAKLGGTGMPVAIRVSMQFKETEIRTKSSYKIEDGTNMPELRTAAEIKASADLKDGW